MAVKNARALLQNARTPELGNARGILIELVDGAIGSVSPYSAVRKWAKIDGGKLVVGGHELDLGEVDKVVAVGGGKACGGMALAVEQILGDRLTEGVVNIPVGAVPRTRKIRFVEAGHPIPTESSVRGVKGMMSTLGGLSERDLAICLISGGGSALMSLPAGNLGLGDLQETTQLLLKSGATIYELNAVRKHLSAVKGGQMAKAAYPARMVSLIISDVVGDRLDTIASGPTVPDQTTYSDALSVLEKYNLTEKVPVGVLDHLKRGAEGKIPETPKAKEDYFRNAFCEIIASNRDALEAAERIGRSHGLNVHILTTTMQGEARKVGEHLSHVAREVCEAGRPIPRPALLLSGGETTVTVKGKGVGGRNQELALAAVRGIADLDNVTIASFSTDGIDGPTDAAGAVADGFTLQKAVQRGLDPSSYLKNNDSYHFFKELGDLLLTGPTKTNVMDVVAMLIL